PGQRHSGQSGQPRPKTPTTVAAGASSLEVVRENGPHAAAKVWIASMYPTNALAAPLTGDMLPVGGGGAALTATISIGAPRAERRGGWPVGTDAGADTGPYATVTDSAD